MTVSRRNILRGMGAAPVLMAGGATASPAKRNGSLASSMAQDIETYVSFGDHISGGGGDQATRRWMAEHLDALGFAVAERSLTVPDLRPLPAHLSIQGVGSVPIRAHVPCPGFDRDATLSYWFEGASSRLAGRIVVFEAPSLRHSTFAHPMIARVVERCTEHKAAALLIITHGPSGEVVSLNTTMKGSQLPVGLVAPQQAGPILAAAHKQQTARLKLSATTEKLDTSNIIASLPGEGPALVVSTPISGWGPCAGERGPGIAVFRQLAQWAARRTTRAYPVTFAATSGHELSHQGAKLFLQHEAPSPSECGLWLHLGAGIAARDWHEAGLYRLLALSSADPQRFFGATEPVFAHAEDSFEGLIGLEKTYRLHRDNAGGELKNIVRAGYKHAAGCFGAHRLHHTALDDMRAIEPSLLPPLFHASRMFIEKVAATF